MVAENAVLFSRLMLIVDGMNLLLQEKVSMIEAHNRVL